MFSSETPLNIMEWKIDDVWRLIKDPEDTVLPKPRVRLNYVKMLYDVLDLQLTPDVALAATAMSPATLCISPAGGGKTTWAQIQAIMYKLLYPNPNRPKHKVSGHKILCLVYNKHNVQDMRIRHEQLVSRLKIADIKGLNIDDEINASTLHAFCDFIRTQYVAKLNMLGFTLLDEVAAVNMMERSIRIAYKKMGIQQCTVAPAKLLSLYAFCRERMVTPSDIVRSDKFQDVDLPVYELDNIFKQFESSKRNSRKYDYADMLTKVAELLESDDKVLADVQRYYQVIIADEVQDFTPIMWRLLKLFVSNGTPLTCIGDEDQCIYHFRGASMQDLLKFSTNFDNGKVYSLLVNRRCRKTILDEAKNVIEENTLRFNKKLVGIKDGGCIQTVPYNTTDGQIFNLVERLKQLTPDELQKSVCCFREQKCSQLLIDVLEEEQIPFYSVQGIAPFSHEIYKHLIGILNALELPYSRETILNLYKVLPCTYKQMCDVLGYNPDKRKFMRADPKMHFAQYDYGSVMQINGFTDAMLTLVKISKEIKTKPLSSYFDEIFTLFCKYHWKYRKKVRENELDDVFELRAKDLFNYDGSYPQFFDYYQRKLSVCASNNSSKSGIAISTFHGLKGLEFENVFVTFMDDDIFPNFSLIESRKYDRDTELELKESETRLWYVTITRAITNLTIYYSSTKPSKFVQDYLDRKNGVYVKPFTTIRQDEKQSNQLDAISTVDDFDDDFNDDFSGSFVDRVGEVITNATNVENSMEVKETPKPLTDKSDVVNKVEEFPKNTKNAESDIIEKATSSRFCNKNSDFLANIVANL